MGLKQSDIVKREDIQSRIFNLRGVQVILDRDLAEFYAVTAKQLRQQIKRNLSRFPEDFMFKLTKDDVASLISQDIIQSRQQLGGALPYAFTEQGVAAISSILRSERAVDVGIRIVRSFVAMRQFIKDNIQVFQPHGQVLQRLHIIEERQTKTEAQMDKFGKFMDAIAPKPIQPSQGVFHAGKVYDAHEFVSKLVKSAKQRLILLDNYVDDDVLTLFAKKKETVELLIYTRNVSKAVKLGVRKLNKQNPTVSVHERRDFHDRFLIVDNTVYHIGASIKDLGKEMFAFSKLDWDVADILKG